MQFNLILLTACVLVTALAACLLYQSWLRARAAQQTSAAVLRGASDGIHIVDRDGNLLLASDSFFRMLGREPGVCSGLRVDDWDASHTREHFEDMVAESLRSGKQSLVRTMHRRSDGSSFHVEVSVLPQERDGQTVLFCSSRDISDRLQAEGQARQAQELMIAAIDAAGEAFVMYDHEDRLAYCNEKYRELYASTRDLIVVGARFEDLVRGGAQRGIYLDAIGREDAFVAERLAAHRAGNTGVTTRLEDGRVIRVQDRQMPNGYIIGFRMDITDLLQATQRAEDAARSKASFLANMSHEIRTPMNAILGLLNLLQNTELTVRQLDYVGKTEGAAQSLLGLLNDILDFSKVDAGKTELESEPFQFDKLLRNLSVLLSAHVGAGRIAVLYDIDAGLPPLVRGDAMRLQQVLVNLGANAIKFTEEGQVLLSIRVLGRTDSLASIEFAVEDTGIGIAPEHQQHIFSGFSQAEASTTRRFGGTGLGLAISKRLVELMGGEIQLQSAPGQGSRFSFALDLPTLRLAPEDGPQPSPDALAPQSILVVDSNPTAADLSLRMLRARGWTADLAACAADALEMVAAACAERAVVPRWPLICMDWQLPDMDSWECTRRIRHLVQASGQAQPGVIMVTAQGRDMAPGRLQEEQDLVNGFLLRPFTWSMMQEALADASSGDAGPWRLVQGRSSARQLSGMRVLVVEDNLINQQVADELLSAAGATVSLAANGQLGVDAVAAAAPQFDVVLMDVQMPVLDGYGATRAIREQLGLGDLPIVAMTANALVGDREVCLAAGMNAHIGKPFDMAHLVSLLIRVTGLVPPGAPADALPLSAAPARAALPVIAGIDLQTALGRMGHMVPLYLRTARDFVRILDSILPELQQGLAAGNGPLLRMQLHTLKGNAATLGATELAASVALLETRCAATAGAQDCAQALDALAPLLQSTREQLCQAMAQLEPVVAAPTASAPEAGALAAARAALREVTALAAAGDMDALLRFAQAREVLTALPDDGMDRLEEALQNLDLEACQALGEAMLHSWSASEEWVA